MKIEVHASVFHVYIYGEHPDNYDACFVVKKYGTRGYIDLLKSDKAYFYKEFDKIYDYLALEIGVIEFHAVVTESHAKVIKRLLGKKYDVQLMDGERIYGRNLRWIKLAPFV